MSIDAEFVERIVDLGGQTISEVDGKTFSDKQLFQIIPDEPCFPGVVLNSLDGLVDYVKDNKDEAVTGKSQIVCTCATVDLVNQPTGNKRKRDVLAQVFSGCQFAGLEKWMDQETFRIWMMTQFKESEDQFDLMMLISKITDENIAISEDNGMSQTVTARVGIAPQSGVKVPSPIKLRPIRTFEEIEQPEGTFVYRLRKSQSGKGGMEMALFEVATNWKRTAALAARDYLKGKVPDMTVLA